MSEPSVTAVSRRAVAVTAAAVALCVLVLATVDTQPEEQRSVFGAGAAVSLAEALTALRSGATASASATKKIVAASLPGSSSRVSASLVGRRGLPKAQPTLATARGGADAAKTQTKTEAYAAVEALAARQAEEAQAEDKELRQLKSGEHSFAAVETRAAKEAATAKTEGREVRELKAELLKLQGRRAVATGESLQGGEVGESGDVAQPELNTVTDMRNGRVGVGAGYWDSKHTDDNFEPLDNVMRGISAEADRDKVLLGAHEHEQGLLTSGDAFANDGAAEARQLGAANAAAASNKEQPEFAADDNFVAPPMQITPNHRLPLEAGEAGWEGWVGREVDALWEGPKQRR
jgi:hypothetical protein